MRAVLEDFPGIEYGFTQPIEMRVSEMLTGSRGDVAVKIFGPDLATVLGELAQQVAPPWKGPGARTCFTPGQRGRAVPAGGHRPRAAGAPGLMRDEVQDELRAQVEGLPPAA
jgi:cobalt-zinc-cadmium resistance protein CzcA